MSGISAIYPHFRVSIRSLLVRSVRGRKRRIGDPRNRNGGGGLLDQHKSRPDFRVGGVLPPHCAHRGVKSISDSRPLHQTFVESGHKPGRFPVGNLPQRNQKSLSTSHAECALQTVDTLGVVVVAKCRATGGQYDKARAREVRQRYFISRKVSVVGKGPQQFYGRSAPTGLQKFQSMVQPYIFGKIVSAPRRCGFKLEIGREISLVERFGSVLGSGQPIRPTRPLRLPRPATRPRKEGGGNAGPPHGG